MVFFNNKEKVLEKLSYFIGLIAIGLIVGLAIFLSNRELRDLDAWLHLKSGQVIVEQGRVPTEDVFSCTVKGKSWNNHSWFFQAFAYWIYSFSGFDGLALFQGIIVGLTLLFLLFLGDIKNKQFLTIAMLFLTVMLYQGRINLRPDIFSFLFFVTFIYIVSFCLTKRWGLVALCFIQLLWVNSHGFFIFGPLVIGISLISEMIKRCFKLPWEWNVSGRLDPDEYRLLGKAFILTLATCLINPQFLQGAAYPFRIFIELTGESSIFFNFIAELQKPLSWSSLLSDDHWYYKVMIFISFYSFIVNRKRMDIFVFFLWLFFLLFSLQAMRNVAFFGLVAYMVCMANCLNVELGEALPVIFKSKAFQMLFVIVCKILLIFWILNHINSLSYEAYYDFDKKEMKSTFGGVSLRRYPDKAVDFILEHNIRGNFFNDFNSGAYLVGRCFPQINVFLDGRTELYGPSFFRTYRKVWEGEDDSLKDQAVEEFHLTGAFLNASFNKIPEEVLSYFYHHPDWVAVYLDYDGMIFLKDIPDNQPVIEQFRLDQQRIHFPSVDLIEIGVRKVTPYRQIGRAYTLQDLGLYQEAREQIEQGLLLSPGHSDFYYILGRIYLEEDRFYDAFTNFRIAAMIAPKDFDFRYYLAYAYEQLDELDIAIEHYENLAKGNFKSVQLFSSLARAYALADMNDQILRAIQQSLRINASKTNEIFNIVEILFNKQRYQIVQQIAVAVLRADPRSSLAYYWIGRSFEALGQSDKAQEAFERGLRIDPQQEEIKSILLSRDR